MAEPLALIVAPISSWPWPRADWHHSSKFRAPWMDTDKLLRYELERLGVELAVLEIDVTEGDLRRDGWIRADARVRSPRVVVSFEHPKLGPLRYPCDRWSNWQDNVRAIALSLQALRAVDRYGVTSRAEQYTGWKALPADTTTTMTAERAAQVLASFAGADDLPSFRDQILKDPDYAKVAARGALKATHPDRGGRREDFEAVQTAREVLTAHHGATV